MKICSSYRCAVRALQHCFLQNAVPTAHCCSATEGFSRCNCIYEDLLFIQVCSDSTPVRCNTVFCKMQSPLLTAALQDRLTEGFSRCNCIYEDLLFIQVAVTQHQCAATLFFAKCSPHCSLLLCNRRLFSLQLHL